MVNRDKIILEKSVALNLEPVPLCPIGYALELKIAQKCSILEHTMGQSVENCTVR